MMKSARILPVSALACAGASGAVGATASINYGAGPPNAYPAGIVCLVTTSLTTYTAGGASFIQVRAFTGTARVEWGGHAR